MDVLAKVVQVLSVVIGVVISVVSFNFAQEKEAEARKLESARPFLEERQKLYMETVKTAAVLANPETHSESELLKAKQRFRELYVAELSMVECPGVESAMKSFAEMIDKDLAAMTPAQIGAYHLAHALRDSFVTSWGIQQACPQ
ncbi:MAG: hypothetical protein ABWY00_18380 [Dongiaceae bacterium]